MKDRLKYQFNVFAQTECELLTLSIQDFAAMKSEYVEAYDELFKHAYLRLERLHVLKLHAIEYCENYLKKQKRSVHESRMFHRSA